MKDFSLLCTRCGLKDKSFNKNLIQKHALEAELDQGLKLKNARIGFKGELLNTKAKEAEKKDLTKVGYSAAFGLDRQARLDVRIEDSCELDKLRI